MKRIEEFTHEELIKMEDADIERQVMLECALDGVRILPPPAKYEKPVVERRGQYFELVGADLKSTTEAPLFRIAEAIRKEREHLVKTDYEYKYGYDTYYVKGNDDSSFIVERRACFLLEDLVAQADKIAKAKEIDDQVREYKKQFDEENARVIDVRERVFKSVFAAKRKQDRVDWLKSQHAQYVTLADGNQRMADDFFWKAYGTTESDELLKQVAPRDYPAEPMPA